MPGTSGFERPIVDLPNGEKNEEQASIPSAVAADRGRSVLRLSDLDPHGTSIIPLIGSPISGVVGPLVYNKLFDEYGIAAFSKPIEIRAEQLPSFLDAVRLLGITGFVLTSPLKSAIVPLLDDVDDVSLAYSSVNAVRIREDGRAIGRGLDGTGVVGAFDSRGVGLAGKRVLMLGAGGVGGVLASGFATRGAAKITILNRTEAKAARIARVLNEQSDIEVAIGELTNRRLRDAAADADIVLQATTLGMKASSEDWGEFEFMDSLHANAWVMEAVSNPPRTRFVAAAQARGLNVILGMDMMVEQLAAIFSFLLDVRLPDDGKEFARQFYRDRFDYRDEPLGA